MKLYHAMEWLVGAMLLAIFIRVVQLLESVRYGR